jgi:hypothetical protein
VPVATAGAREAADRAGRPRARLLRGPRDRLHCDEWPCLLELHADDPTPQTVGDTIRATDLLADLREQGWDVGRVQIENRPFEREDGGRDEVLVMALRPHDREPTPDEALREAVRQFWLRESTP